MEKLNIQRIEENKYAILFTHGPGSRATNFGLIYDAKTDAFDNEGAGAFLWERELNDIKQLAKNNLPTEIIKSFWFKSGKSNYIVIYESRTSVLLFCRESNFWMKFVAEVQDWNLRNEYFRLKTKEVYYKAMKKWPEINLKSVISQKYKPDSPPINGTWFEWDDEAH